MKRLIAKFRHAESEESVLVERLQVTLPFNHSLELMRSVSCEF